MSGLYSNRKEALKRQRPTMPAAGGMFHRNELRRLLAMLVAALVIGVVSLNAIRNRGKNTATAEQASTANAAARASNDVDSVVVLPDVDVQRLEELVSDATIEERVILDLEALEWAFDTTRRLREPHYVALGAAALDADTVDALLADPPAYRGRAFRARGWLEDARFYEAAGSRPAHFRAALRLEGGGRVWVAVRDFPDEALSGESFVRVDGLFIELFRDQVDTGWAQHPLIVGREAVASYPALADIHQLPTAALEQVRDDTATEVTGLLFEPFWELLAYAGNLERGEIDWSTAPLLTMDVINAIHADGEPWRGKPVRFPSSEVLDCWTYDPGENPARLEKMTEGWLGNWLWKGPAVVARFRSPARFGDEINRRDVATARGFFLKNLAYEARDGSMSIAPFFVLHSAEIVPPAEKNDLLRAVTMTVAAGLLGLGGLVAFLLVRDRRRSRELQADLVRRRRARREQRVPQDVAADPSARQGLVNTPGRRTVSVHTTPPYDVRIGSGVLDELGAAVGNRQVAVVCDATAARLHGAALDSLGDAPRLDVGPGEAAKGFAELERALEFLAATQFDRTALVVGFGGGAACDLAGLAAALYKRGVAVLQAPTTLLAQVDASVGGKTAINLAAGKNLAGAFHQPCAVLADTATLATLSPQEWRSGLGEALKTALLAGEEFLAWLERAAGSLHPAQAELAGELVERCVRHKAAIVVADEHEARPRRALNLGHSFAHAIEHAAGPGRVPHGIAVSAGLGLALEAARTAGVLADPTLPGRVAKLQERLELPRDLREVRARFDAELDPQALLAALAHDKKAQRAEPRFVLPIRAGQVSLDVALDPALVQRIVA